MIKIFHNSAKIGGDHLVCLLLVMRHLFSIIFSTTPRQPTVESSSESDTTGSEPPANSAVAPPGMSEAAVKRVTADSPLEPNKLEQVLCSYSYYLGI